MPTLRSPVPQLLVDGVATAAATITLLQGPATVRALAEQIRTWALSASASREEEPEPDSDERLARAVAIIARTSTGELRLEITVDSDVDAIVSLLDQTVFRERRGTTR